MDDEEIAALIRSDESDRVERKESLSDRVREAICAFANDLAGHQRPAVVVVGQRDDLLDAATFALLALPPEPRV